jgi:lipopolysaccharide/colanic/teichoic acid biosynthesis glycosyltransferase
MTLTVKITKRAMDLACSAAGLAATVVFFPLIAAAIYLESPGPVFFSQRRAGELLGNSPTGPERFRFREFSMFKFRTMQPHAERNTGAVLAAENDPRITRVGRFLRKTRLDELPQLFNVLRGDMSLVGPRPERTELLIDLALAIPLFEERMRGVKPGITGLAQVSLGYTGRPPPGSAVARHQETLGNPFRIPGAAGALADDMRMKLLFDLAYGATTERFSTFLRADVGILLRTPLIMLKGMGR